MECTDCNQCGKRVGWIGLWTSLGLGVFKFYIGVISGSHALIASAFCSLTDIISSMSIIFSSNITKKPRTSKYPYGYGKVEFVVSMLVSFCIVVSTFFLSISSLVVIVKKVHVAPRWIALFAAVVSGVLSLIKYRYSQCVARQLDSPAIQAHADHNKTDGVTAILVAVTIILARMGLGYLDPLIAIFETAHILHTSVHVFIRGVKGLLDVSVSHEKLFKIENASCKVNEVKNVSRIRARQTGQDVFVDISVNLHEDINVAKATLVKRNIKKNIFSFVPQTREVLIQMKT